jgi:hypothetical protein
MGLIGRDGSGRGPLGRGRAVCLSGVVSSVGADAVIVDRSFTGRTLRVGCRYLSLNCPLIF